ncbi:MAG: prepilin-type N-terminal cleavage/methylation domain-containing protein [Elusimicrobiota bacterium]|nr:prepilin-type N-terminal cleavage/methylation domain-containing protein [Endomicrobiia bacterium]MDW8166407.1 prepilin-type N-terminal cleavage/methylation domain-containing protein [Elusimicrobiota bacterium]
MKKIFLKNDGFTFMELIFVMLVIGILMSAFLPTFLKAQTDTQLAEREISSLKTRIEAIRWYFIDRKTAPTSWNDLKTQGYLPSTIGDSGIFGAYNLVTTTNPSWIVQIEINNVPDNNITKTIANTMGNVTYDAATRKLTIGVVKPGVEAGLQSLNDRINNLENQMQRMRVVKLAGIYTANSLVPKPSCMQGQLPRIYATPVGIKAGTSGYSIVGAVAYADDAGASWALRGLVKGSDGQLYTDSGSMYILVTTYCE